MTIDRIAVTARYWQPGQLDRLSIGRRHQRQPADGHIGCRDTVGLDNTGPLVNAIGHQLCLRLQTRGTGDLAQILTGGVDPQQAGSR